MGSLGDRPRSRFGVFSFFAGALNGTYVRWQHGDARHSVHNTQKTLASGHNLAVVIIDHAFLDTMTDAFEYQCCFGTVGLGAGFAMLRRAITAFFAHSSTAFTLPVHVRVPYEGGALFSPTRSVEYHVRFRRK